MLHTLVSVEQKFLHVTSLVSTLRCKLQVPVKETTCIVLVCYLLDFFCSGFQFYLLLSPYQSMFCLLFIP